MQGRVVLGKYVVGRFLGRGSMGQVYLAKAKAGGADVVVKFMHAHVATRPRFREMFAGELQMMARFRHPHAVALLEGSLDEPAGPCIVMEYVPGDELGHLLERGGRMDAEQVGNLVISLCQALNAAHEAGIIHRDLKPANLMIGDPGGPGETVTVMDLGLASLAFKPYIPVEKLQGSGDEYLVGSPAYMSPEQIRGDDTDSRGDLYSLGVIMYECLAGRMPFEDEEVPDLLKAHLNRKPPTFAQVGVTDVPPKVEALVQQLLAKYPNERPQTAYEVAHRYLEAFGIEEVPDPTEYSPRGSSNESAPATQGPAASSADRVVQNLEAWMPEAVAVVKLRGFLEDLGARVVESQPGLIRVRLGEPSPEPVPPKGILAWFRRKSAPVAPAEPPTEPVAIDLYLTKKPGGANRLELRVVFSALEGPLPADPRWHRRTKKTYNDLRAYLMAQR